MGLTCTNYCDDGVVLGLVMWLRGGADTYAYVYTAARDALRRLGACWSDDAARRAVEGRARSRHRGGRAVVTEEWLEFKLSAARSWRDAQS